LKAEKKEISVKKPCNKATAKQKAAAEKASKKAKKAISKAKIDSKKASKSTHKAKKAAENVLVTPKTTGAAAGPLATA